MKTNLKDSKTYINLAKSYIGECQAQTRYKFIAYGAKTNGYEAMSKLIDDVVNQEFTHARMFYSFIQTADKGIIDNIDISSGYPFKEKWDLSDNLNFAAKDEKNESQLIYPEYEKIAREEGFDDIAGLYKNIIQVENCHMLLFEDLYNQMKTNTLYAKTHAVKWKCGDCGYEVTQKKCPDICPLCQAKQGFFMLKINDNN